LPTPALIKVCFFDFSSSIYVFLDLMFLANIKSFLQKVLPVLLIYG
jgi:hypothetical protein